MTASPRDRSPPPPSSAPPLRCLAPPPSPASAHPLNPCQLLLVTRPAAGRGVFTSAGQTLAAGTTVERSPVLVLGRAEWLAHGRQTALEHYAFVWGRSGQMAVAFGLGSMFNHSPTPNVSYVRDLASATIHFITAKRIPPATELTISYGPESALWFVPDYQQAGASSAASSTSSAPFGSESAGPPPPPPPGSNEGPDEGEEESAEALLLRLARELAEEDDDDPNDEGPAAAVAVAAASADVDAGGRPPA